ncbi:ABC transporter substrate-binding protein [Amycolatopsis jejuensis]|uniref:ABC transporter substrate-binding protein n=1 Tax=Amycolatopsis jejuensis TaxID=330084 RepID=UPI00052716A9|nr:ABC transporter substrate-binding protein [Amycolatopsis jejuensis]
MRTKTRLWGQWGLIIPGAAVAILLTAACTGQPASGGAGGAAASFTFALPAAPISLDITKDFDGNIMQIMAPVTEKLELVSETGEVSPGLATSVAEPDPTTLVYTLRPGVKFSDGKPLTSADVVWSLQHAGDAKAGAQTAGNIDWVSSVSASGPLEVTVKTKHPVPNARASIAVVSFIQQAEFAKAHEKDLGTAAAVPVGTGPYRVTEDTPQQVTLSRNPEYRGPAPRVDQIHFSFISQGNAAQLAMRSGALQGSLVSNLKTVDQWKAIPGTTKYELPSLYTTFLTMDTSSAPLDDIHVRRAIAYSVDRAGVMAAGYGEYATLLKGLAAPGLLVDVAPSDDAAKTFLGSLPQYALDPAKAKAELAQSSHASGFSLDVPVLSGDPASELVVQNLAQNMKPLGVTITAKTVTASEWISTIYAHGKDGKHLGMQTMSLVPSVPDPNSVLGSVTGQENIRPQGFNLANWSTPEVEAAYTQLTTSTDKAQRWQATQTLLKAVAADVPYLPLFAPHIVAVLGGGFTFDRQLSFFDLDVNGTWVSALKAG